MDGNNPNRHFPDAPPNIPMDLISLMIVTLTVRSLWRMCLVNREWNELIMSDRFGRIHRRQMEDDNQWVYFFSMEGRYRPLRFDGRYIYYRSDRLNAGAENQIDVLCSCSGLAACVSINDEIFFWNPMTHARATIPVQPIVCPQFLVSGRVSFSLGHNTATDDFVLVRITLFGGPIDRNEVMLFSRNSQTWSTGPSFPYSTPFLRSGICIAGYIHWLVDIADQGAAVARLSLATLTYSLIALEVDLLGQIGFSHLDRMGGNYLCIYSSLTPRGGTYNLCVLMDYNDPTSWTRVSIELDDSICELEYHVNMQPLHFVDQEHSQILFRVNPVGSYGTFNMVTGTYERMHGGYEGIEGHMNVVRFLQTLERPNRPFV